MRRTSIAWPAAFAGILVLVVAAPALAHRWFPPIPAEVARAVTHYARDEVLIGRRLGWAGFAVYADAAPLPRDIPAMHWSTFRSVLERSGIEASYHSLLENQAEIEPPFSVLTASIQPPGGENAAYAVGPIALMQRRDIAYWRVVPAWLPHDRGLKIWQKLTVVEAY
jgi:hypothetical protein